MSKTGIKTIDICGHNILHGDSGLPWLKCFPPLNFLLMRETLQKQEYTPAREPIFSMTTSKNGVGTMAPLFQSCPFLTDSSSCATRACLLSLGFLRQTESLPCKAVTRLIPETLGTWLLASLFCQFSHGARGGGRGGPWLTQRQPHQIHPILSPEHWRFPREC